MKGVLFTIGLAIAWIGIQSAAYAQSAERWDLCVRQYMAAHRSGTQTLGISPPDAEVMIRNIASSIGLNATSVTIMACPRVGRAVTIYSDGSDANVPAGEYMFYNEQWVREVTGTDRVQAIALFGHELGHLLNRDFLPPRNLSPRNQLETDADAFAGCAVAAGGGDWPSVENLFSRLRAEQDSFYPNRLQSLGAAHEGFERCRSRARSQSTSASAIPIDGSWTVVVNCPTGAKVQEQNAQFVDGRYTRRFGQPGANPGETHISMYLTSPTDIRVTGEVIFDSTHEIYALSGGGTGMNNSFSGVATFGANVNCPFNATRN